MPQPAMSIRPLFATAVALALALGAAAAAAADAGAAAPQIRVTGTGSAAGTPDEGRVVIGVEVQADTAAAALAEGAKRMARVSAALDRLEIPAAGRQSLGIRLDPLRAQPKNYQDAPPPVVGFRFSHDLSVTVAGTERLGPLLDAAVKAGADTVSSISLTIADPAPLLDRARAAAVADARRRAETYATAAGLTLGPVVSIGEPGSEGPSPMPMMRMAMEAAPGTRVEAGAMEIQASVTVTWELVKPD